MYPQSWSQRAFAALVLLLMIALGARIAAELLAPLVPALVVVIMLLAIGWFIIGRRR
jgi:hypothetical protein